MPDTLTTVVISAAGTLFTGLASGMFIPRWVVSWMQRDLREAKAEAVEALRLERQARDVQSRQLDKLLDGQQVAATALDSIERHVRTRDRDVIGGP